MAEPRNSRFIIRHRREAALMRRALRLAERGRGRTSPNPVVGAVLVGATGEVVGEGYHRGAGEPHAEIEALRRAGSWARGATLFVTLTPCGHWGRTPPCAEALIEAGVARVVAACEDPNPAAAVGVERLRNAGVVLEIGLLEQEARKQNEAFFMYVRQRRPFVTIKCAMTLDGRMAAAERRCEVLTCEASIRAVHRLRAAHDAILVGIGTVLADDPRLTVRMGSKRQGTAPLRVVVDSLARTPPAARLFSEPGPVLVAVGAAAPEDRIAELRRMGAEVSAYPGPDQRVDLAALLRDLAARGKISVLVEGGAEIVTSMIRARLADKLVLFVAPRIAGDPGIPLLRDLGLRFMEDAIPLHDLSVRRSGLDLCIEGYF